MNTEILPPSPHHLRGILGVGAPLQPSEHDAWLEQDRATYAAVLALPALAPDAAMQIITRLLAVTQDAQGRATSLAMKHAENRLIAGALSRIPITTVLPAFAELGAKKVNNQRTSDMIRSYVFGSHELERWAVTYRAPLRRLIKHALGERTVSSCLRMLAQHARTPAQEVFLTRAIFRFTRDRRLAGEVFLHLFGKLKTSEHELLGAYLSARKELTRGRGLPFKTLQGIAGTYHPKVYLRKLYELAPPEKLKREIDETLEHDTSVIALLRRWYRGEKELVREIRAAIAREAEKLPFWDAEVAVVLDASRSMRGVGHRLDNAQAIAVVIAELIRARARRSRLIVAGGSPGEFPSACGIAPLAPAIIQALKFHPDVVVVLTDGFENAEQGDAASVAEGLTAIGVKTPIVQVVPSFTQRENLAGRRLAEPWPLVQEDAISGFDALWIRLWSWAAPAQALAWLRSHVQEVEP